MSSLRPNGPRPSELERNHILNDIVENIENRFARKYNLVDYGTLKKEVLIPVIEKEFNSEIQLRGFLRAFRNTSAFKNSFESIGDPTLKKQITAFIEGKPSDDAVRNHDFEVSGHPSLLSVFKNLFVCALQLKEAIKNIFPSRHRYVQDLPEFWEDEEQTMKVVVKGVEFENWGQTVKNTPRCTCVPTTVYGVQQIVRYAKQHDLRVRCGGYRHSWSNIFSQDNEIFISLLDLHQATKIPDIISILPGQFNASNGNQLRTIELKEQNNEGKRLCRVGVSVTNEDFRRWAIANDAWSLPVDVILVEVTIGGVNGPICHGAGYAHKTVSDYVQSVEYVDCNGDFRTVDDQVDIKASAGAFGLLGVVTHITFELDAMTYAVMKPLKVDIGLAIPPINKDDIPTALQSDWFHSNDASKKLADAKIEFDNRAANHYYSEWFWFTYQRKAWVNTWNATSDPTGVEEYPDVAQTFLQWIQGWLGGVITTVPLFNALPGYWQAQLLATNGMAALPPTNGEDSTPTIITALPNALHFRRGIQNMRVRDTEFQIPIPPRRDDPTKPDFSIVQQAWWDVIKLVYQQAESKDDPSSPMRLTLELRIMGGSDVIMAPQRGNSLGTASIEVLTIPDAVADDEWMDFIQKVADIWMSYGDDLNVRPHWAKEWDGLQLKGQDARKYLKNVAYLSQIDEFRAALRRIGKPHGWGLDELRSRFSNELWDEIVFD
ncbi:hypothetical protein N7471_013126 [Penicillium samsonianum]|uniref:uncharacterized protein n=1 Tax=Penicillium samsonianum TaxID=1882272 RepID=UPI00254681F0|nr:uncharacterized protein N7471_013126 [Penicillium samsonianum]KAJ6118506.1 hypothetical protein N7471_013126 [Penicillium samsonianum]